MHYLIEMRVEPKTEADRDALLAGLRALATEDETLSFDVEEETREIVLKGQSELHLDIAIDMLMRQYGIALEVGAPQIAYREVLMRPASVEYTHTPRSFHPGKVKVVLEAKPLERDAGDWFSVNLAEDNVDLDVDEVKAVEKGVDSVRDIGVIAGFPIIDCEVTLKRLQFIGARLPLSMVEVASRIALREACDKGGVELVEPVMAIAVTTPCAFVGQIIGDLDSRRGQIRGQRLDSECCIFEALVPLANLFGYINDLRAMTDGRADYTMTYSHYQRIPRNISGGPDDDTFPPAVGKRA